MTKICTNCDTIYPDHVCHCPRCNYNLERLTEDNVPYKARIRFKVRQIDTIRDESMRSKIIKQDESIRKIELKKH